MPYYTHNVISRGWDDGEDGWGSPTNRSLQRLAYIGTHLTVIAQTSTPTRTGNPVEGDTYIFTEQSPIFPAWVSIAPQRWQLIVWGRDPADYSVFKWLVIQPPLGCRAYDISAGATRIFTGAIWKLEEPAQNKPVRVSSPLTGDGVNTPIDITESSLRISSRQVSGLATVATSGSYTDLRNRPTPSNPKYIKVFDRSSGNAIRLSHRGDSTYNFISTNLNEDHYLSWYVMDQFRNTTSLTVNSNWSICLFGDFKIEDFQSANRFRLAARLNGSSQNWRYSGWANGSGNAVVSNNIALRLSNTNVVSKNSQNQPSVSVYIETDINRGLDNFSIWGDLWVGPAYRS